MLLFILQHSQPQISAIMDFDKFYFAVCFVVVAVLVVVTESKVVRYTFRVSYITDYPDGVKATTVLGINGRFPGPVIEATVGDTLEITVINNIQDGQNVTLHWHGIHQRGTPFEDGRSEITQCPIKAGKSQVYTFPVPLAGTHWYHSHVNSQYVEGLWGAMIIRGAPDVHQNLYDEEILITLSDWYHTSSADNEKFLLSPASGGAPPYPSSALMNAMGRYPCTYALKQRRLCLESRQRRPVFRLQPGKTYRLRLINTAGWTAFNFTIEGHTLRTIEVDGVDTVSSPPVEAVHIACGQRYSFLLTVPSSGQVGKRFLIRASLRTEFLFTRPHNINQYPQALMKEVTGVIQYSRRRATPTSEPFGYTRSYPVAQQDTWGNTRFLDEISLIPYDRVPAPENFTRNVQLDINFAEDSHGIRRGSFNNMPTKLSPNVPQLARMLHNVPIYEAEFPVYITFGEMVQVVVNNPEKGPHPIHLHGHHFWVMGMGNEGDGNYNPEKHVLNFNGMRRDTVLVMEKSWLVIRFRADNVGVWTLHCHVDWHMLTGMMMSFVEAPELAHTLRIPAEARRVCADHNIII